MVRNFYVNADIDGRANNLTGGPSLKEGGMSITITQRNNKTIEVAVNIKCEFDNIKNKLVTKIFNNNGQLVFTYETDR